MFAFPFGMSGRFLLKPDVYERGYGLRTALNLIYPRSVEEAARLRAVDSKRHGASTVRSRFQASEPADFETFDVNRLRDVVNKATGTPADVGKWGYRIGGGDSVTLNVDMSFEEIGKLCGRIERAHAKKDYKDRFDWIDYIQPVTDPDWVRRLEQEVVARLRARDLENLGLAPPEIVDWDRVTAFRYHFDRPQGKARDPVKRPELRLPDYLGGLGAIRLESLDVAQLQSGTIKAVDGDGSDQYRWTVWRCLVGELVVDGNSFVLDEGEFFQVRSDYLEELDAAIQTIPSSNVVLPPSTPKRREADYNREVADGSSELILLDKKLINIPGRTTPIEVCDLLSKDRQLVHVKRHLGSSDLSHLFAQGLVSAELLQMNLEFRQKTSAMVKRVAKGLEGFDCFADTLVPSDFEVVYAIIAPWKGRPCAEALPFFSKVNLREVVTNLRSRGFRVGLNRIETAAA
jgi:uncharacterized protein (TIGR04141 family)